MNSSPFFMHFRKRISPPVVLGAAVLMASALLPLPRGGTILGLPSICPFNNTTGLPCPGCGLTRSFVSLGHGDLSQSLMWHPLGPLLFGAILLYLVVSIMGKHFPAHWQRPFGALTLLTFAAFWVLRLSGVFPLPSG